MNIEQRQAELIDHFVKQASNQKGKALGSVVVEATSQPALFAFSEILAVPNVGELEGTENSACLDMLQLFARGTWSDYKNNVGRLPPLVPDQVLKLKQLNVLTLAETNKESFPVVSLCTFQYAIYFPQLMWSLLKSSCVFF